MSYHGRFESQKPKKKKRAGRILLIVLLILVLLGAAAAVAGVIYYNKMLGKMDIIVLPEDTYVYTEETTLPEQTDDVNVEETAEVTEVTEVTTVETTEPPMTADDIINILVVGQASRAGEESHMADTTILVTINTYNGTVKLSSVLRDAYVKLPDYRGHTCGRAKFTVCYNLGYQWGGGTVGGMEMTNICMRDNFGVEIDHNVEIDFESFVKVVDAIGGIEVELTEAEARYLNDENLYVLYDVQPGTQWLDGMASLAYVRMRKAEGDNESDIKRSERQRMFIEAMLNKIRHLSVMELQWLADQMLPLVTTTMKPSDIADLLLRILPLVKDLKIESDTIPVSGTGWGEVIDIYDDGIPDSVIKFETAQQKKLIRAFTEAEITN